MKKILICTTFSLIILLLVTLLLPSIRKEKVEAYTQPNISYFHPKIEAIVSSLKLFNASSDLQSFRSLLCTEAYPNYCRGKCYTNCEIGFFYCFENGTATCISVNVDARKLYDKLVRIFKGNYSCFIYDIPPEIEETSISLLPNFGSNVFPYLLDVVTLYNWTKNNIRYIPGGYSSETDIEKTFKLKAGKCDEQAKLLVALIASIGGVARVRSVPGCQHAWAEVFVPTKDVRWVADEIDYYSGAKWIEYFEDEDGIWIPLDTSGSEQPGSFLSECKSYLNESEELYYCKSLCPKGYFYYNNSCFSECPGGSGISEANKLKCLDCPPDFPFTYNNTCVNACPSGTGLALDGRTCISCPEGYFTYNNTCVTCPKGYYLGVDGKCYRL